MDNWITILKSRGVLESAEGTPKQGFWNMVFKSRFEGGAGTLSALTPSSKSYGNTSCIGDGAPVSSMVIAQGPYCTPQPIILGTPMLTGTALGQNCSFAPPLEILVLECSSTTSFVTLAALLTPPL